MLHNPPSRTINARFHSKCMECREPVTPGMEVLYTPSNGVSKATVRHIEGQCPAIMDYVVQLVYRCTSKLLKIRALSASDAIIKATPKRTARETDSPCEYVVRQGNIEVLRENSMTPLKRGLYETEWGNTAYVSGPNATTAKDLDMGERIPIMLIIPETWQPAPKGHV